jgi:putative addiction module component (TIGR02574 family)
MNARTRQLVDEILVLPADERALAVAEIEASLDEDEGAPSPEQVEAAWTEELKARLDDVVSGRVKTRDADEVLAELRATYPRR